MSYTENPNRVNRGSRSGNEFFIKYFSSAHAKRNIQNAIISSPAINRITKIVLRLSFIFIQHHWYWSKPEPYWLSMGILPWSFSRFAIFLHITQPLQVAKIMFCTGFPASSRVNILNAKHRIRNDLSLPSGLKTLNELNSCVFIILSKLNFWTLPDIWKKETSLKR